jgi:hypothetical protein
MFTLAVRIACCNASRLSSYAASAVGFARDLRRKPRVRERLHLRQGQCARGQGEREDGRVGGIRLRVDRRIRKIRRKKGGAPIDCGLDFLFSDVNVEREIELERDDRAAE